MSTDLQSTGTRIRSLRLGPGLVFAMLLETLSLASPASAQTFTELYSFEFPPKNPGALAQGSDGNFFGTTRDGGARGYGTAFKITPGGAFSNLFEFAGSNGRHPQAALLQGSDGNLYGTTVLGGASDNGTVFRMTPGGTLFTLVSLSNTNGRAPLGHLIEATGGLFYGTTSDGGASGKGTVFKMTPDGTLTTLVSFSGSDGGNPYAGLLQGRDGDFYGTTYRGGASDLGTVFKVTPDGVLTTLASFSRDIGILPRASLVQANGGNFYGTTAGDANRDWGTVFKMTPDGTLTRLVGFAYPNGLYPMAAVTVGSDWNFYGTTYGNCCDPDYFDSFGTLFRITPAGTLTTLFSFGGSDTFDRSMRNGGFPTAGLVQGVDGNFYGTTSVAGSRGAGNIFRLSVGLPVRPVLSLTVSNNLAAIHWTSQPGRRYRVQFKTDLSATNWANLPPDITSAGTTTSITNTVNEATSRFYRVLVLP